MLRAFSLCACCHHYPGAATEGALCSYPLSHISFPRKGDRVSLRIDLFEACPVFTRVTACTLAGSPYVIRFTRGFSYFVTSITTPVASGWSTCRVGLSPTGKRRLITAHTHTGRSHCPKADARGGAARNYNPPQYPDTFPVCLSHSSGPFPVQTWPRITRPLS